MRLVAAIVLVLASAAAVAQPLTTSFTYQGELKASGSPASGLHDFQFRLFDASAGGAQVGTTLCSNDVALTGGRFTVGLDFGAAFNGQRRFLEVSVRADAAGANACANTAGFTLLTPRQELTVAPGAAYAMVAGAAATASFSADSNQLNGKAASYYLNASNFTSGVLPPGLLTGTYSAPLGFSNPMNTFAGIGTNLTLLNASNLSTGTVSDGLLSGNIPRLNTSNTFSGPVNSFGGVVHSTIAGYRFPDNSVQMTAALDPGRIGFSSGYPQGTTVSILINSTLFANARMAGSWRINRPTTGSPQWSSYPTFRRPRTADGTWFGWVQNNTTLANMTISIKLPNATTVNYVLPQGRVGSYRLLTGDDGLPFEEITYVIGNAAIPNGIATLNGTVAGVVEPSVNPRVGETTGTLGMTYRSVWGNVRSDSIAIVGNPVFTVPIDPNSGVQTGQVGSAMVTVRANALSRSLGLDATPLGRVFRLVLHPNSGPDIDLTTTGVTGTIGCTVIRLADDGIPVEEYEVTFPLQPPP